MNRAERAYRSNANKANRDEAISLYNKFSAKIDRSRYGSPKVANNTFVWRKADGKGGINYQLHATVLATLYPDGSIEFARHHWYSVTTHERLRRLVSTRVSGYHYWEPGTNMPLFNSPKPPKRNVEYSDGVPKLDIWDYSMPDIEGAKYGFADAPDREYGEGEIRYMEYQTRHARTLHAKYGTFENWRNARREYLRDGRKYRPAMRQWVAKYSRDCQQGGLYYPGIGWDIKAKDNL